MNSKIKKIKEIVEKELNYCPGHNIEHVLRVYNRCLYFAKGKKLDLEVLEAAALLHDIGGAEEPKDITGKTDHALEGAKKAGPILKKLGFSEDKIKHIQNCIASHRYKNNIKPETIEAKILFDADKLDTVGAIGIARAFVWVGRNKANIYYKPNIQKYIKENLVGGKIDGRIKDRTKHSPQIEIETKLKLLKDKLYTEEAKKVFSKKLKYFKIFLDKLEKEIYEA